MKKFIFKTGILDYETVKTELCTKIHKINDKYELFCLRNRLSIYTQIEFKWFGNEIYIEAETNNPEKIQKLINRIISEDPKYCILYPFNFKFPEWWIKDVISYIDIPTYYYPYVGKHGLKITIYDVNYHDIFNKLNIMVDNTLTKMYNSGYIVVNDQNFIRNWELVPKSIDNKLVKPKWNDKRFGDTVMFLKSRLTMQPYKITYFKTYTINPENIINARILIAKIMDNFLINGITA